MKLKTTHLITFGICAVTALILIAIELAKETKAVEIVASMI